MAAPVFETAQLPSEAANEGKLIRLLRRIVSAESWYDHVHVPVSRRDKAGVYYYSPAQQSVANNSGAQDATATGFFWLQNPAGGAKNLWLRELVLRFSNSAATAAATAPRIVLARFTFTGTASGSSVTPAKRATADASPVGFLRTAVTGMTVSLVAQVASFNVPVVMTAVGELGHEQAWPRQRHPMEDDGLELAPGEGAVLYQPDNGSASEPRRFTADWCVEEVDAS